MATAYRDIALREMGIAQWVRKGLVDVPTNDAPIDAPIEARSPAIDSENILFAWKCPWIGRFCRYGRKTPNPWEFRSYCSEKPDGKRRSRDTS
jgi:hypothetical protein